MKQIRLLLQYFCLAVLVCGIDSRLLAQTNEDVFAKHHQELLAKNPDGLNFTLKLKDSKTEFHIGEKIRLQLNFTSSSPDTFVFDNASYDRSGRLSIDSFVIDRPDAVSDPLYDYYHSSFGFMGGGLRGIGALGSKPEVVVYDLNEWLRFEKPGRYRLYIISHRLSRGKAYHEGNTPADPVSNIIDFEVIPSDRNWEQDTLSTAAKTLDVPPKRGFATAESDHRSACRVLRFMGSEAAIKEIIRRLRGDDRECDSEYYMGLVGAANRPFVIEQMETALVAPTQPVSSNFLSALVFLAYVQHHPEPWQTFPNDDAGQKAARAQFETRRNDNDLILHSYIDRLANAVAQKQGAAAAMSIQTLLNFQANDQSANAEARRKALVPVLAKVFFNLPVESQRSLLDYQWKQFSDPVMLPVLRQLYQHPPDLHESPAPFPGLALRRIYELAPDEGRQLILEEIRNPKSVVGISVLGLLPDKTLPELEDAIVERAIEGHDDTAIALVSRYGSAAALPRLRAAFEPLMGRMACREQSAMISYFLRVDQTVELEMIRRAMRSRQVTRCFPNVLTDAEAAGDMISPEFEALAADYLNDENGEVVLSAVSVLCKSGTIANREKIKSAIRRLLERWREEKVDPYAPPPGGISFAGYLAESILRKYALAVPWITTPEEFRELAALCLTEQCRQQLRPRDLTAHTDIHFIYFGGTHEERRFSLGDYYDGFSWAGLKQKVLQFPKGTKFTWSLENNSAKEIDQQLFDELKNFLKDNGYELVRFERPKNEG